MTRCLVAILILLTLLPAASALHPAPASEGLSENPLVWMHVAVAGSASGDASGSQPESGTGPAEEGTYSVTWTYAWRGTVELRQFPDDPQGTLRGNAWLSGGGAGSAYMHIYQHYDGWEHTFDSDCAFEKTFNDGQGHSYWAMAKANADTGALVVSISTADLHESDCRYNPALSPLDPGDAPAGPTPGGIDLEPEAVLRFEIPTSGGDTRFFPSWTGDIRGAGGKGAPYCGNEFMGVSSYMEGTCRVSGQVKVNAIIDPCARLWDSFDHHVSEVGALTPPPSGSSESQVRAFAVAARAAIGAYLGDARALDMYCGGAPDFDEGVLAAAEMILDAWRDVERTHGLGPQATRDLISAIRAHQMLGGEESDGNWNAPAGSSVASDGVGFDAGTLTISVHSPVSLHVWDADGRHVGWDLGTNAPESGIAGATYEGQPGGAQTITVPAGVYKITADEWDQGSYAVNLTWGGVAGNGTEFLPLRSFSDRTMATNVLFDDAGFLWGGAQRIASGGDFRFVEPRSAAIADIFAPQRTAGGNGGSEAGPGGGADGGLADGSNKTPPASAAVLLMSIGIGALLVRRQR